jgi:tetratricopeptide (TPR) repeat protein
MIGFDCPWRIRYSPFQEHAKIRQPFRFCRFDKQRALLFHDRTRLALCSASMADESHTDVTIHGPRTRLRGVKAARVEHRPWLEPFPVCPILNRYRIAHVGLMTAVAPYEILRDRQTSTYFLACSRGRGRFLVEGTWRECRPGMAYLLPARISNGLRAVPNVTWEFCWVCYIEPPDQRPALDSPAPVAGIYDHAPLQSAILGLMHEARSGATPAFLQRWVELIHEYVQRFAGTSGSSWRLRSLWDRVTTELDGNWTLERLAREAGYSAEHLRRLCHLEIGRSPMHQVIFLRMRRAAELLATTTEKVGTIAQQVGYEDPFVFSRAFHRWIGWGPSEYRTSQRVNGASAGEAPQSAPSLNRRRRSSQRLGLAALLVSALTSFASGDPRVSQSPAARMERADGAAESAQVGGEQQDRALRDEQLAAARELYAAYPASFDAAYVVGFVSNEQGDSASAIRYWEDALRREPLRGSAYDRAGACYSLGYAHLLRENYEKAIPMLRQSIQLNPQREESYYRLAHALFLQGAMEECLRVLDDGKIETPLAYRLRGQANQQLGNLQEAKRSYQAAVRLDPRLAEAYYGLATTCARLGETALADESRRAFDNLKSQGQAMGRQARTDFDPFAITRRSLAQTHTEVARVHLANGQGQKAERLLLRAAGMDGENTACRFQLVMLYQQAQRNQEALDVAKQMVTAQPRNPFHHLAVGNLHLRLKQAAEAEAAFRKVTDLAPGRPEGFFALAQLYLQTNTNRAEALQLAARAVTLAPTAVNHYVLSQACAMNDDLPAALTAIDKACNLDPRNPQYQEWRSLLRSKRPQ